MSIFGPEFRKIIVFVFLGGSLPDDGHQVATLRIRHANDVSNVTDEAPRTAVEMRTPISGMSQAQDTQPSNLDL